MSISTELSRIQASRDTIRTKLIDLGLATSTDKLDKLATVIEGLVNHGAVDIEVKEGETYTIPAGYHDGTGIVAGVAGGGNYTLQSKTVTPTKQQQSVTSDEGYYGLSSVAVTAIPDAYQDVTGVTLGADEALAGKIFVDAEGNVVTGKMTNNGKVDKVLDVTTVSFTIPKGYHNGTGTVTISLESKTVTPTKASQTIVPTTGKVLNEVVVNPIPDAYQDVTEVTTVAENVLAGDKFVDAEGTVVEGTMTNNGSVSKSLNTTSISFTIPKGYHDGTGAVSITLETKNVTPTKSAQTITPTNGKVLDKVVVAAIPDAYQDVTKVTATADKVLAGSKFVNTAGTVVDGTMTNVGNQTSTIDGLTTTSVTISKGYHDGTGTVSLTGDIEEALAAI